MRSARGVKKKIKDKTFQPQVSREEYSGMLVKKGWDFKSRGKVIQIVNQSSR